jgi:hypothetical protein
MNRVRFWLAMAAVSLLAIPADAQPLTFSTLAGYAGQGSADGTGGDAQLSNPSGVAIDAAGNLYIADTANHTIRKVTSAGEVSTLAGSPGQSGSVDDTGPAARFNQPQGVAVDSTGNVYVADTGNHTIRRVTPAGAVTTLAGLAGVSGSANGTGSTARFYQPEGVAVDSAGYVYVADTWNHTLRKVTPGGAVSTLAGAAGNFGGADGTGSLASFYEPQAVAVDSSGFLYVADTGNQTIRKVTPGGTVSTFCGLTNSYGSADGSGSNARFYGPAGVALDALNNLYVADSLNRTVRKVTPAGVVSTLAGLPGSYGTVEGTNNGIRFWGPLGIAARGTNNVTLYIADPGSGTIRKLTQAGTNWVSSTLAGSPSTGSVDGIGTAARFYWPRGAALDIAGNAFVADTQNGTVRKVTPEGAVTTLAGKPGAFGNADGMGTNAQFYGAQGIAMNGFSAMYVADTANHTIRKVTVGGAVNTFAGSAGNAGIADGIGSAARFNQPQGIAAASDGTLYVADTWNHTIRKITSAGIVSTLAGVPGSSGCIDGNGVSEGTNAARFYCPSAVAVDAAGTVYVADTWNHAIRMVTASGAVTTLAGLPGVWGNLDGTNTAARFALPAGIAVDPATNVLVLDTGNQTIRKLVRFGTNWVVSTVAGAAGANGSSDGSLTTARFNFPGGLAVDLTDFLYLADTGNSTIRQGALVVNTAPYIVGQPQSLAVNAASDATFSVAALGATPLSYQWRFNQATISGATQRSYTRTGAQNGDIGSYSVLVTNSLGSVTSEVAVLTLNEPPSFVAQPQRQTVLLGQAATFNVVAAGTLPLSYQWRHNGAGIPGATLSTFGVPSVQRSDEGSYSVLVTNVAGAALSVDALLSIVPVEAWGDNSAGQLNYSADAYDVIAIAGGAWHSLALRSDGTVLAWGENNDGQCDVPPTLLPVLTIAAGGYHSLALQADGTVAAWGANNYFQTNVPAGLEDVIGVGAGTWHSLAVRRNGSVVAWGDTTWGQTNVPVGLGNVVAIAAGGNHSLALQSNGVVVAWGENTDSNGNFAGQSIVPAGLSNVVAIAAGEYHSLAVRADGSVVAWGANSDGQTDIPGGANSAVAVAGGGAHSLALKSDGTLVAWGANWNGQCNVPAGVTNVIGLAAGRYHSLALRAGSMPVPLLLEPRRDSGRFSALVQTLNRKSYALEFSTSLGSNDWNALSTNAGNGALRQLVDPTANAAQRFYRMRQW